MAAARHGNRLLLRHRLLTLQQTSPHGGRFACISSSSSSSSSSYQYTDPALEWGRTHPHTAQECLAIPPLPLPPLCTTNTTTAATTTDHNNMVKSLQDYWKWRQWKFPVETAQDLAYAQALTSHVLSAPLTLAVFYHRIITMSMTTTISSSSNDPTTSHQHWCCVGARAEATLPLEYWKEFLVAIAHAHAHAPAGHCTTPHTNLQEEIHIAIDFVGPDIHPQMPPQTLSYHHYNLQLQWLYKGYLHNYNDVTTSTNTHTTNQHPPLKWNWNGFVLLNPGLGHNNLQKGWEPTLDWILSSQQPILLTAHSDLDAQRDYNVLRKKTHNTLRESEAAIHTKKPSLNPFASRITYQDPFDDSHMVQPNHSYLILT